MATESASKSEEQTLIPFDDSNRPDVDWQAKIAKAKEARKAGLASRKGKPATFSTHTFGPA